jgi:hypothetical protein
MEGEESKASHRAKAELLGRLQYWILPRWRIPLITRHHERRAPEVRRLALPIGADVRIVLLPVLQGRLRCRQCRERQPSERTEGMPVDEGVQPTQKDMIESRTSSTFRCRDCGQWKPNSEEQGIPNGMFGVYVGRRWCVVLLFCMECASKRRQAFGPWPRFTEHIEASSVPCG